MQVTGGATDVTTYFALRLASNGTAAIGLTVTDFDLQYVRSGAAPSAKVDATALAATDSAHGDNKAIEIDATDQPALYRVDWPDAAFAAGAAEVILTVKCATCFTEHLRVTIDPEVNVTRISGDSTAADNLELMYDGTGYTDETGPASRSQVDAIGAASGGAVNIQATEDNTGGAIIDGVTFVGSVQGATTFANTEAEDGVVHDIDDVANDIDIVYGYSVGGGRTATSVSIVANVNGNTDEMKVKVYDHVGSDWEIIGTIAGSGGSTAVALDLALLLKHTGTGGELGKVYIRFDTDSTTPSNLSVDKCLVQAVSIGQSVGYSNGSIWIDTNNGVAGTEAFVNGVADNPVDLLASAKTLSASVGISDFHVINGSALTLAETSDNESYFGDNWTLALGGQSCVDLYVSGAAVSGVGTAASGEMHFEGCDAATMSCQTGHFDFCGFSGTVTMTLAGDYNYHDCYSKVAGAGAPTFTKTAGQAITGEWRRWSGGITVSGIQSGDTFTISGELGTITLNGADGTVEIRGIYKAIVDNRTGSPALNTDGAIKGVDVADILVDTDTTIPALIASAPAIADAVWDEAQADHVGAGKFGAALQDGYWADIGFQVDDDDSKDRYVVRWFKNHTMLTSGITVPVITVVDRTDGSTLINGETMTDVGTGKLLWAESTNRQTLGTPYEVTVTATIDGASRTWTKAIGRDI